MKPVNRISVLALAWVVPLYAACPALDPGKSIRKLITPAASVCFVVRVAPGEAAQIVTSQPADIEIHLENGDTSILIDSFEFGPETITIPFPGQNHLEVRLLAGTPTGPSRIILMSRTSLSLQAAQTFRYAENQATNSKRSRKPADIADSLRLWQELGDTAAIARTYLQTGYASYRAGNLPPARDAFELALALCRKSGDVRCAAEAITNSGAIAQQLGDFDASLARLNEATGEWRKLADPLGEGQTLSNLGLLFRQTGDYQRAISHYDRAARTLPRGAALAHAVVLNNLGVCFQALAEFDKARHYFEAALRAESALRDAARDEVRARLNLGRNFMMQGQHVRALAILNAALADAKRQDDRPAIAIALNNLGQTLLAAGRATEAQPHLEAALKLHRILGDNRLIAADLHYLGVAAAAGGRVDAARQFFTQATELRRACSLPDAAADSLFSLATLERDAGNRTASSALVEQALTLLESVRRQVPGAALRASFYAQKRRFFDLLTDLALHSGKPNAAADGLLAAERGRGRALLDLLAEGSVLRPLPPGLLQRRQNIQRQLSLLSLHLTGSARDSESGLRRQVEALVGEDERIEADIRQEIAGQEIGRPLRSLQELQGALPAGSALLEFHLGERESYLWLADRTHIQVFALPPRATIEAQARRVTNLFGRILERRRSPEKQTAFQHALGALSVTLLGPLRGSALPGRLVIAPDGILGRVPFAALTLPSASTGLGLTRTLIQVPAAAFLIADRPPRPVSDFPQAMLALVDPVFSLHDPRAAGLGKGAKPALAAPDLARLPFSGELDSVPRARRVILRGFDASPTGLQELPLEDFAVLHFSTHALVDDRIPELSRIALSMVDRQGRTVDGFLRPYQLAGLHLNGSTVVLSACDTALGKEVLGEGLAGLTASLFRAGASQLLLTLAEVDAEGSSEFLRRVYGKLFSGRSDAAAPDMEHALTQARVALARSGRWADPYYWASFVLYGRPNPL